MFGYKDKIFRYYPIYVVEGCTCGIVNSYSYQVPGKFSFWWTGSFNGEGGPFYGYIVPILLVEDDE
jgi:hypothetical protein